MHGMDRGKRGLPPPGALSMPGKRVRTSSHVRATGIAGKPSTSSNAALANMSKLKKDVISKPEMKKEEQDKNCFSDSKSEASASDSPCVHHSTSVSTNGGLGCYVHVYLTQIGMSHIHKFFVTLHVCQLELCLPYNYNLLTHSIPAHLIVHTVKALILNQLHSYRVQLNV